jgi:hypothetical protein
MMAARQGSCRHRFGENFMSARLRGFARLVAVSVIAASIGAGTMYLTTNEAGAEAQPHMRAALASLQNARNQLQAATADKGGHRAKAIELVTAAIDQVNRGIAFDNRR